MLLCPTCRTPIDAGWLRRELSVSHSDFGKLEKCLDSFHSEAIQKRLQKVSQMGEQDIKRKLSDIIINDKNREMILEAKRIIVQEYGWLFIYGGPGNAKSEVLKAIVNAFNQDSKGPAMYTCLGSILDYMRLSMSNANNLKYFEEFERLKSIRVLAIDEMDKPNQSNWMQDFRFHFLDARYISATNRETVTIFAGQANPESYGDVLFDRFGDGRFKVVYNSAPSARAKMKW